jgi:hypothetical protein
VAFERPAPVPRREFDELKSLCETTDPAAWEPAMRDLHGRGDVTPWAISESRIYRSRWQSRGFQKRVLIAQTPVAIGIALSSHMPAVRRGFPGHIVAP